MMIKKLISFIFFCFVTTHVFAETELDYMEYADDTAAQAAYVSSDAGIPTNEYSSDTDTKLLLHLNNNVTDSGNTVHTITNTGVTFDGSIKKFGSHSGIFDGGTDYLSAPDHVDWDFSTGDWTVDFWIRRNGSQGFEVGLVSVANNILTGQPWVINFTSGNYIRLSSEASGSWVWDDVVSDTILPDLTWTHMAIVRYGNTVTMYQGGAVVGTRDATGFTYADSGGGIAIGRTWINTSAGPFDGHLDEIRVSKGIARWTAAFTTTNLQSYSESTIVQQGTYSLKGVAVQTDSLNDTLTRTVNPTKDLSGLDDWVFWIYSNRTGSNIKVGIRDSGGTTTETTPNITSAGAWQKVTVDISGVSNANKDAIDRIILTPVNADAPNTFYVDNMFAESVARRRILLTRKYLYD